MIASDIVDWAGLLQVIWVAAAAGLALIAATSLAILGTARANSERRDGRRATATLYGTLAVIAVVVCAAEVVLGVSVMLSKG